MELTWILRNYNSTEQPLCKKKNTSATLHIAIYVQKDMYFTI